VWLGVAPQEDRACHFAIAEEMTLQEMRKARELTQEKLAKSLGAN